MSTPEIAALERCIAAAQEALRVLRVNQLTPEGWSVVGPNGVPPSPIQEQFAKRHGCVWNAQESEDLMNAFVLNQADVKTLASVHQRTEQSIRSQINRITHQREFRAYLSRFARDANYPPPDGGAS